MTIEAQWSADDQRRWDFHADADSAGAAEAFELGYEAALPGLQAFAPRSRAMGGSDGRGPPPSGAAA